MHEMYGVKGALGRTKRAVFVLDGTGIVRWSHASQIGLTVRGPETIAEVLRGL